MCILEVQLKLGASQQVLYGVNLNDWRSAEFAPAKHVLYSLHICGVEVSA